MLLSITKHTTARGVIYHVATVLVGGQIKQVNGGTKWECLANVSKLI